MAALGKGHAWVELMNSMSIQPMHDQLPSWQPLLLKLYL